MFRVFLRVVIFLSILLNISFFLNQFSCFAKQTVVDDPPAVLPPPLFQSCFSPDEKCDEKLIAFINKAKISIDIAIFDITHPLIAQAIIDKSKQVKVRMVVDKRQAKSAISQVKRLLEAKVQIRYGVQKGIMHNKFMIIDKTEFETGSFNYTIKASLANRENQLYLSNSDLVKNYSADFEKRWETGNPVLLSEPKKKSKKDDLKKEFL